MVPCLLFVTMAKEHSMFNELGTIAHQKESSMSRVLKQQFHQDVLKYSKQGKTCFFCNNSFDISPKKRFNEIANVIFGHNQNTISNKLPNKSLQSNKYQKSTKQKNVDSTKNNTSPEPSPLILIKSIKSTTPESTNQYTSSNTFQTLDRIDNIPLLLNKPTDSTSISSKSPIVNKNIKNPFLRSKSYSKSTIPIISKPELSFVIPEQSTTPLIKPQSNRKFKTKTRNANLLRTYTPNSLTSEEIHKKNTLDELISYPNCECVCKK
nr:uncharacterized protein LOC121120749 [Lepeophtheirus salmonis]